MGRECIFYMLYLENETATNEKKAMHKKAKKVEKWMDEALRQRWRQRSEQYQLEREQEIKEKETECKTKIEALASALAVNIRSTSTEVEEINNSFIKVATEQERSEAGTLNLTSPSSSCTSDSYMAQKVLAYRDIAEHLKTEIRRLRVKNCEKIEAVRRFWRNNVLEERTRAGRMVMMSLRQPSSSLTYG